MMMKRFSLSLLAGLLVLLPAVAQTFDAAKCYTVATPNGLVLDALLVVTQGYVAYKYYRNGNERKDVGKDARAACVNSCIACRLCEKNCPADAIRVTDNIAVIDPAKCIRCGMCAVKCPRGVIRDLFGIMTD